MDEQGIDPVQYARDQKLRKALENASLRINLRKGSFPYGRVFGSRLHALDLSGEHVEEQAAALANEALLDLEGVTAVDAALSEEGIKFTIKTAFGAGEVLYGKL